MNELTDGKVLCAETVMNPLQMYMSDDALSTTDDSDQLRFLLTLRYTTQSHCDNDNDTDDVYLHQSSLHAVHQYHLRARFF